MPAHAFAAASSATTSRSWSSASAVTEMRLVVVGDRQRPPLVEVDVDEGLMCGHHQRLLGQLVRRELEGDARAADTRDTHVDIQLVVEACGREVLDVVRAHHEVAAALV